MLSVLEGPFIGMCLGRRCFGSTCAWAGEEQAPMPCIRFHAFLALTLLVIILSAVPNPHVRSPRLSFINRTRSKWHISYYH